MKVGYIRVSSVDQCTDRQLDGIELDRVYEDKLSGKNTDRPELKACMNYLREGDTLYVHSIDRLARNLFDLQEIVNQLLEDKVCIVFVTERLEFGGNDNPMSHLMLQMMGAFAEFERKMIKARQMEGIRKAKERGQQLGRAGISKKKIKEIYNRLDSGQRVIDIAHAMNVGSSTIYKYKSLRVNGSKKSI